LLSFFKKGGEMSIQTQNPVSRHDAAASNSCCSVLMEPFGHASRIFNEALQGKKIEAISQTALANNARRQKNLSLTERVTAAFISSLLFVPLINIFVLKFLKAIHSNYLPSMVNNGPFNPNTSVLNDEEEEAVDSQLPSIDVTPISPEAMAQRKREALARLAEIEALIPSGSGLDVVNQHFEVNPRILRFNLQRILRRYENPNRQADELLNFMTWNGNELVSVLGWDMTGQERNNQIQLITTLENQRAAFERAVNNYANTTQSGQYTAVKRILGLFVEYFTQMRQWATTEERQNLLKKQFERFVISLGDANRNCVDQMLSQLQNLLLHIIAEGDALRGGRGNGAIQQILFHFFGLALCQHRADFLRYILYQLHPNHSHQADLERAAMRTLAGVAGMEGEMIFEAGAAYESLAGDLNDIAQRAADRFLNEYNPLNYLIDNLKTYHGSNQLIRNELLLWVRGRFATDLEDTDNPNPATDIDPRISEDRNHTAMVDGGNLSLAGLLFILSEANLVRRRPPAQRRNA
jgi:hypothetical protein